MLDGYDHIFPHPDPFSLREAFRARVEARWPNYQLEEEQNMDFLYRDSSAYVSWDRHGATEENSDLLVTVIYTTKEVTLVTGSKDDPFVPELRALTSDCE